MLKAKVYVTLRPGILDPQGEAVCQALHAMAYQEVDQVRVGKYLELMLTPGPDAEARVKAMCESLLANTVIETYRIEFEEVEATCAAQ